MHSWYVYQCSSLNFALHVFSGDILGPSIDGLENLLRMPTGCGEQNMIKLAPDLYIANYLTVSGQMTPSMQARVKHLIETGERIIKSLRVTKVAECRHLALIDLYLK